MEIELLYLPDCPNRSLARAHVDRALARTGREALVREQEIRTSEDAARLGMRGSPTILIDGHDPFGVTADSTALSCRLYQSDAGFTGAPTVEQLIEVLADDTSPRGPTPSMPQQRRPCRTRARHSSS